MYNMEELAQAIKTAGDKEHLPTIQRRIKSWYEQELLPAPTRPPIPGKRGRGPLVFPEPAHDAVLWLAQHRRFIDGADVAKFWLWLEGFDYIAVDLNHVVSAHCAHAWEQAQTKIPSLPPIEDALHAPESWGNKALDDVDKNITTPALERSDLAPGELERITLRSAQLGLFHGREDLLKRRYDDGADTSYAQAALQSVPPDMKQEVFTESELEERLPSMMRVGNIIDVYAKAASRLYDWNKARDIWKQAKEFYESERGSVLTVIQYDVLRFMMFFESMMVEAAVPAFEFLGFLEDMMNMDGPKAATIRKILLPRFRETARFLQDGMRPIHRRQIDDRLQHILQTYGDDAHENAKA